MKIGVSILAALAAVLSLSSCGGGAKSVRIELPLPSKLDLSEYDHVFLAGFIADVKNEKLDADREAINFFNNEFGRREGSVSLVKENPADLSDRDPRDFLARRQPFFKQFNFDGSERTLALTGVVTFERLDRSGFREVQAVDLYGRRYKRTQFVEATGFNLELKVYVYELNEGNLLYRGLFRDAMDIEGDNVDQRLVFYDLMERISGNVMGLFNNTNVKAERKLL